MKYVTIEDGGVVNYIPYEDYLDRDRKSLARLVDGDELLDICRFAPPGRESFHDARFEQLLASTSVGADGRDEVWIELRLKGPYFDRHFDLKYLGVKSCTFEAPQPKDDLLIHELRREGATLIHEFEFDEHHSIYIECRQLRFVESLFG